MKSLTFTLLVSLLVFAGMTLKAQTTYLLPSTGETSITACGGTLYDDGGASGNYTTPQTMYGSTTILPATTGNVVRLTFSSMNLAVGDYVFVFDGLDYNATLLGQYVTTTLPSSALTATNASGALTVVLYREGTTTSSGFAASISCTPVSTSFPDLSVDAGYTYLSNEQVAAGSTVTAYTWVDNNGTASAAGHYTGFYLSTNTTLDVSDTYLTNSYVSSLAAGGTSTLTTSLAIPTGTTAGSYYILFVADYYDDIAESNETNNVSSYALTVTGTTGQADFQFDSYDTYLGSSTVAPGGTVTAYNYMYNAGTVAASNVVGYYLSTNSTYNTGDVYLGTYTTSIIAANWGSSSFSKSLTIPTGTTPGSYYILYVADYDGVVAESNETNNVAAKAITVSSTTSTVDFTISTGSSYLSSSSINAGSTTTAYTYIYNNGTTSSSAYVGYYLSTNTTFESGSDTYLDYDYFSSVTGGSYSYISNTLTIPTGTTAGSYYLLMVADYTGSVTETNETNNIAAFSVTVASTVSTYCNTDLNSSGEFDITAVTIAGTTLNNTAIRNGVATGDGSYYTNFPASGSNTGTLTPGSTYSLTVGTANDDIISVWIDYNQNLTFETTEWTQVTTSSLSSPATVMITIPTSAKTGQTRMRIRSRLEGNTNGSSSACLNMGSGCTEDYTVTIGSTTPAIPVAAFSASTTATTIGQSISFSDLTSGVPTSWSWTFQGGTPSSSTSQNPVVTYAAAGTYNVTLTATNSLGTDTETKTGYIVVTTTPQPDYTIASGASLSSSYTNAGNYLYLTCAVNNIGSTSGYTNVGFYLSTNTTYESGSDTYLEYYSTSTIAAGGTYSITSNSLYIPSGTAAGVYYILMVADYSNYTTEVSETNNMAYVAFEVTVPQVDLLITSFTAPTSITQNSYVSVSAVIKNQGKDNSTASDVGYYLSTDSKWDVNDTYLTYYSGSSLSAGTTATRSTSFYLPSNTVNGNYYLLAVADYSLEVSETNETNNVYAVQVAVTNPFTDIAMKSATVPSKAGIGNYISLSCDITNAGTDATSYIYTAFYLSTDQNLNTTEDIFLTSSTTYSLSPGAIATVAPYSVLIPSNTVAGTYYIICATDYSNSITETNETNNNIAKKIDVSAAYADLTVTNAKISAFVSSGTYVPGTVWVKNTGNYTVSSADVSFFLSTDNKLDVGDNLLDDTYAYSIMPDSTVKVTGSLYIPYSVVTGSYYILAVVDENLYVTETNETNNTLSKAVQVIEPKADLVITQTTINPAAIIPGSSFATTCYLKNDGTSSTSYTSVSYYLSTDKTYGTTDVLLGTYSSSSSLYAYDSTYRSQSLTLPSNTTLGKYYLLFIADFNSNVTELSETNNVTAQEILVSSVGVEETEASISVSVYPNPVADVCYIKTDASESIVISIYNMTGALQLNEQLQAQEINAVDLSNLSAGVYFMHVITEKGSTVKKLVVK